MIVFIYDDSTLVGTNEVSKNQRLRTHQSKKVSSSYYYSYIFFLFRRYLIIGYPKMQGSFLNKDQLLWGCNLLQLKGGKPKPVLFIITYFCLSFYFFFIKMIYYFHKHIEFESYCSYCITKKIMK